MAFDETEDQGIVLLIERDEAARCLVEGAIKGKRPAPTLLHAATVSEAAGLLESHDPDLILAGPGLDMPECLELIDEIHRVDPGMSVILLAAEDDEEAAVTALARGAEDYLPLRGSVLARLPFVIGRAAARRRAGAGQEVGIDLLRSLSHELRSPLAGLAALVEMLSAGADGALSTAQASRVRRIRASVERLVGLADQITDLARLRSGVTPLDLAPLDFASLLLEAEDALIADALTRGVDLRVRVTEGLPKVMGDATRLGQALRHLISAVLRHTASGTLEISAHRRDACIEVVIEERTAGIPVEAAGSQLLTEAETGHDLGLSIAARLLRMHGGSLRKAANGGSSNLLCFTLPAAPPEPAARRGPADQIRPSP